MSIDVERLVTLVAGAGRLVGVQELLRAGGWHPGQQTELKRALRELVKEGRLERDGKRFGVAGAKYTQVSGPAWRTEKAVPITKINPEAEETAVERGTRRAALHRTLEGAPAEPARGQGKPSFRSPEPASPTERRGRAPAAQAPTSGTTLEGVINHHPDGFAFVKPLVGRGEDVFIPPQEARKALDHDQVVVEVIRERDGRFSGRVLKVKARTRQLVVGTYVEDGEDAWVEPREREIGVIAVPKTQLARPGDAVKVRLGVGASVLKPHEGLSGEVAGSLGSPEDHSVEVLSVAFSRGFQDEFPPEVMDAADSIELSVSAEEAEGEDRKDLRSMPLVTIDGEDARDFDDAIWVEEKQGGWRLVVAIADVSHYVTETTALDDEALRRATSVYLPGRVLPMLPERLSNGICSLKPDEDRLCMVADMQIDSAGKTTGSEIYPAVMRSHARCTYTEVHQVLAGEDVPGRTPLKPLFQRANELAQVLRKMRTQRGSVDFDLPETRVELGDDGLPLRLVRRERWESHRLVEECMLAANEAVARFFRERDLPTVNRYHGEPDEERLATFVNLLKAYGVEVPEDGMTSSQLNDVLLRLAGHPEQRALHQLALRSMMQAVYTSKDSGHYGLGAEDYLHFTSPIRRYPDLLVHRLLKEHWAAKGRVSASRLEVEADRLEALAGQCSERERAAMQVEREVNSLYSCLLVKDKVGEEFEATVSSLTDNGFFVELDELYVEGMVKGETVGPRFEFDPTTYRMYFTGGRVVRVGHELRVVLTSVNLQRKQIDFEVVEFHSTEKDEREPLAPREGREAPRGKFDPADRLAKLRRERAGGGGGRGKSGRDERRGPAFSGGRERPRREQPPAFEPREGGEGIPPGEGSAGTGFNPRERIDRLWQQKGGRGAAKSERGSRFGAAPRGGRDERGGGGRFGGRDERGGARGEGTGGGGFGRGGGKFGGRDDRGGVARGEGKGGGRFGAPGAGSGRGGSERGGGKFGGRDDRGGFSRGEAKGGGRFGGAGGRDDRGGFSRGEERSGGRIGGAGGRFGARDDRAGGGGKFGGRDDRGGGRFGGGGRFADRGAFPRGGGELEEPAREDSEELKPGEPGEESRPRFAASARGEERGGRRFGGGRSGGGGKRGSFGTGGSRFGGRGGKGPGRGGGRR